IWNIVYRILGNEADASDCFQEVFLTAVQASRKQKIRNMQAFLSLLATQRGIDLLRKRKPDFRLHRTDVDCQTLESTEPPPAVGMQSKELSEQLRMALSKIPTQEAEVFCLRILNEFSYRQIAEEMNMNENYVGVLINRARGKLQELLKSTAVEYGREVSL
ncbi:MAG: sigma-70 family RNA polymerase sigma factor, partial [Phycisphaerae bacterium]|nr:sigma-70 family RNA polymerase sigma factor [Phycisphaerae bacterium]